MRDYLWLLFAVSPFVALPLGVLVIAFNGLNDGLSVFVASAAVAYGVTGVVLPGYRSILLDIRRHGIHNDR